MPSKQQIDQTTNHTKKKNINQANTPSIQKSTVEPITRNPTILPIPTFDDQIKTAKLYEEEIDRTSGVALFDAFASKEKTLHAHPGRPNQVPEYERDSSARFFARHLRPLPPPASPLPASRPTARSAPRTYPQIHPGHMR